MTVIDFKKDEIYRNELLNYIHSELSKTSTSKKDILRLLKEHRNITNRIGKEYTIQSFSSDINLDKYTLEEFNILKESINTHFTCSNSYKKSIFINVASKFLGIKSTKIMSYLEIDLEIFKNRLSRFKNESKTQMLNKEYKDYINKNGFNK